MVLMSFSEPEHVPALLDGRKTQTTRLVRKNPVKAGDTLQCYYKSRVAKMCLSCITPDCEYSAMGNSPQIPAIKCSKYCNYFGTATVTDVVPLKEALMDRDVFARLDGFGSWAQADRWFRRSSRVDKNWTTLPYVVIRFEPHWLKEGDSQ
jgi:hypothetical protein